MKKVLVSLLALLLCFSCCLTYVLAEDDTQEDYNYLRFVEPKERINKDGSFEFTLKLALTSGKFVALEDTISIKTYAHIYVPQMGLCYRTTDIKFTVTLYHDGWIFDSKVGSYTGNAGGTTVTHTFNVEKGDTYYFIISPTEDLSATNYYLQGTGEVYNVSVK